jgi:ribonuclease R
MVPLGEQCSMTERRADDATREVSDWLKCEYMQDHIGAEFSGVVSTVTNFGLFVRLTDLYIEGLVHVTSLSNDYYHFDAERQVLLGQQSNQSYRMGDLIEVKVLAVNLEARKIDLGVVGATRQAGSRKPSAHGKAGVDKTTAGQPAKGFSHKKGKATADPTARPGKTKAGRGGAKAKPGAKPAAKSDGKPKAPRKRK